MKKLLLTSNGLTSSILVNNFKKLIDDPSSIKLLMISTGPRTNKVLGYIKKFKETMIRAGVKDQNIKVLYLTTGKRVDPLDFDVLFVCGGNTYHYLYYLKKLGLDKSIKEFVRSGRLYVGVSAGTYLVCPTIEHSSGPNDVGLIDLSGLGLTDLVIKAHFTPDQRTMFQGLKKKFKKVIPLKDGQAVLILGSKHKVI